ncbi:MAG: glutamine amidotransferase family protein [Candidatus Bathyarchaeia archaeon]
MEVTGESGIGEPSVRRLQNPYGDDKVHDACGLFGVLNTRGLRFTAHQAVKAISGMRERGNGLGAGFAVYGLYPDLGEDYALHVMFLGGEVSGEVEDIIHRRFTVNLAEEIPVDEDVEVWNPPILKRYFVQPKDSEAQPDEYVRESVMHINTMGRAYVFSSGKNMGVFKGVGYPEDLAEYFMLNRYEGYMWLCHTRFPTNTPGWWGGAHPFNILDWSVIHNGELSSYGANRRFLEMFGYRCTMRTDTEVMAYAFDLLMRRQGLAAEIAARVMAPPLWFEIENMPAREAQLHMALRQCYGGLLMNGPFTVIVARHGQMIGLADRLKLRPLSAAVKDDCVYMASEEAAIRSVCPNPDHVWRPRGGEPVAGVVKELELEVPA